MAILAIFSFLGLSVEVWTSLCPVILMDMNVRASDVTIMGSNGWHYHPSVRCSTDLHLKKLWHFCCKGISACVVIWNNMLSIRFYCNKRDDFKMKTGWIIIDYWCLREYKWPVHTVNYDIIMYVLWCHNLHCHCLHCYWFFYFLFPNKSRNIS